MPPDDLFALDRSDLNPFLLADVGFEANGSALSVMSLFARVGLDPWQEAGRMAKLPRLAAADALARLISTMPAGPWKLPDATAIATRLVALLPGRSINPIVVTKAFKPDWRWMVVAVVGTVVLAQTVIQLSGVFKPAPPLVAPMSSPAPAPPIGD